MPELPEAEVAVHRLRSRILGATVWDCWVGRADIVRDGLNTLSWYRGACIDAIERRGKTVVISCVRNQQRRFLVAELGMTGLLLFHTVPVRFPQHTHFIMRLRESSESELRYWNPRRFGRLYLLDAEGLTRYCGRRFGADPLSVTEEEFSRIIATSRRRLKSLLMHQQTLAGIGNIYANEILFHAGLHPSRIAGGLGDEEILALHTSMRTVLSEAIQSGGSSVRDFFAPDGSLGTYRLHHRVYAKSGEPCPNQCGGIVRRLSQERSSFYCALCQPKRRRSSKWGKSGISFIEQGVCKDGPATAS